MKHIIDTKSTCPLNTDGNRHKPSSEQVDFDLQFQDVLSGMETLHIDKGSAVNTDTLCNLHSDPATAPAVDIDVVLMAVEQMFANIKISKRTLLKKILFVI